MTAARAAATEPTALARVALRSTVPRFFERRLPAGLWEPVQNRKKLYLDSKRTSADELAQGDRPAAHERWKAALEAGSRQADQLQTPQQVRIIGERKAGFEAASAGSEAGATGFA